MLTTTEVLKSTPQYKALKSLENYVFQGFSVLKHVRAHLSIKIPQKAWLKNHGSFSEK
jgi:hypothetical protein